MPVYQYKCEHCGRIYTKVRPMSKMKVALTCDDCGCPAVHIQTVPGRFQRGPAWASRVESPQGGKV